jgi:hypothetical protein
MLDVFKKEFHIYSVLRNSKATAQNRKRRKKKLNNKWGSYRGLSD